MALMTLTKDDKNKLICRDKMPSIKFYDLLVWKSFSKPVISSSIFEKAQTKEERKKIVIKKLQIRIFLVSVH